MLSKPVRCEIISWFQTESFLGFKPERDGERLIFTVGSDRYEVRLSRHGALITRRSGTLDRTITSGLYPQFKSKSNARKDYRQIMGRILDIDWRIR